MIMMMLIMMMMMMMIDDDDDDDVIVVVGPDLEEDDCVQHGSCRVPRPGVQHDEQAAGLPGQYIYLLPWISLCVQYILLIAWLSLYVQQANLVYLPL